MKRLILLALIALIPQFAIAKTDLWQALGRSFTLKDQSSHAKVKEQIRWLLMHPQYFQAFAKNSEPYIWFILEEIKRQKLPGELALLPMIESNYNPFAYSHVGAAGLWQLMPGTGSGLGVKQNWWYDGRRGIVSSTLAALDYMKYLGKFFNGNWIHAIAAYDSGEGTVQRAIRKNQSLKQPTDFWSLQLPRETQAYLPRLLALASIIKYPRYFGIKLPQQGYHPYFDEVIIDSQIDLNHAAKLANIEYAELLKLNPGHNRWTTAPNRKKHSLLLPMDNITTFKQNLATSPKGNRTSWDRYQVKKGDTLSDIAYKKHSSIPIIKQINKLNTDTIRTGQKLLIPKSKNLSEQSLSEAQRQLAINHSKKIGPYQVIHIVQSGESLDKITKKYHVSAGEVIFWNQLKSSNLKSGDKLQIWLKRPKGKIYIVKAGDTLTGIANKIHITVKELQILNPALKKGNLIKTKQKLRIS